MGTAGSRQAGGGGIAAIGVGLAVGILLDTFVVRTVLVPSAAELLGRANRWPGRLGRPSSPEDLSSENSVVPALGGQR